MKPALVLVPLLWIGAAAQVVQLRQQSSFPQMANGRGAVPAQTGKASVEGSVLDAVTSEPVKKATVMLNGIGLNAVTDASGHFAFRQLPAGQYTILVHSERYPQSQGPLDADQPLTILLAAEEQKRDIRLSLTPGASVRGHIVDEDGSPMRGCNVTAMTFRDTGTGRTLQQLGFTQSDDKGEYRITHLPRGKYYIQARCYQTVPLPHAFLRRTSTMDVPALAYAPQFYAGAADTVGAAKVEASPGADLSGIDFQMAPARGVTVRGRVGSMPDRNIQLTLAPQDPVGREWRSQAARLNVSTGEFQIPNVLPGSYELVATAVAEGRSYFGKVSVEVGTTPPEPIVLPFAAAPAVTGSISIEGDTANPPANTPSNNVHVTMNPLEGRMMVGPQPQAEVQNDGTFLFTSVMPGRWRVFVNGVPRQSYVKSVKLGDREVSPWDFEIGSSAVQLKVVVGTKYTPVDVLLAAAAGSEPISAILWPAGGDPGFQQNIGLISQSPRTISVPPGRYYACAFALAQRGMLMQSGALRKALESRCEKVDAPEGGSARVQVPLIPAADLKQLLEKIDE
jgi:hypothetical protein